MQSTIAASQGPDATRLALKLVEWNYGSLCKVRMTVYFLPRTHRSLTDQFTQFTQDVVQVLLKHGRQTLAELRYLSKLPIDAIRTSLIVLIQHNCVAVYLHTSTLDRTTEQLYEADLPRMLQILRMPRFVEHVRALFTAQPWGEVAVAVTQAILVQGRLQMKQLPDAVKSVRTSSGEAEVEREGGGGDQGGVLPAHLLSAVKALVRARLIERVPPSALPPPASRVFENSKPPRKKAASSGKQMGEEEQEEMHREAAKVKMRTEYQVVRFQLSSDASLPVFSSTSGGNAGGGANGEEEEHRGDNVKKRRRGATDTGTAKKGKTNNNMATTGNEAVVVKSEDGGVGHHRPQHHQQQQTDVVLWRLNYDEFNRQFRNQKIVKYLREKEDMLGETPGAARAGTTSTASVVEAMLAAASPLEREEVISVESGLVSCDDIVREYRTLYPTTTTQTATTGTTTTTKPSLQFNRTEADHHARRLAHETVNLIGRPFVRQDGPGFRVCLENILYDVRLGEILSVIGRRFGDTARRIWMMLVMEWQMEQKMVAEKAMVPNAEAREALYAMLKDGYVELQDIPRNNDRAPSKTFYTWRAVPGSAIHRLAGQLYTSAVNVVARIKKETEGHSKLMDLVALVNQGQMEASQLNKEEVDALSGLLLVLQTSLMHLDMQIALFNDM